MIKYKVRWILNDDVEVSIHKTKKSALKEYARLKCINYKYLDTLHLLRHNQLTDIYNEIKIK